ncbi:MAG: Lrp/AsnC family transcriptional regulator [Nanoarchaeota archaeon]|nr:Lrp/AsnC family transcriptional regulator [Nanoarchaeota archaeon]
MLSKNEIVVLKQIRENSRETLSSMSKKINIPISTIFEILKRLERKVVSKHVSLLDFSKLGYGLKVNFLLKASDKDLLRQFLVQNSSINDVSTCLNEHDFYIKCIFSSMKDYSNFKDELEKNGADFEETFVLEELKKEGFSNF